jgi:hypothetical protein
VGIDTDMAIDVDIADIATMHLTEGQIRALSLQALQDLQ